MQEFFVQDNLTAADKNIDAIQRCHRRQNGEKMKNNNHVYSELPMGFGAALMRNSAAMQYFTNLNESKQKEIIEATRYIESKQEMKNFVSNLAGFQSM